MLRLKYRNIKSKESVNLKRDRKKHWKRKSRYRKFFCKTRLTKRKEGGKLMRRTRLLKSESENSNYKKNRN